MGNCLRLSTSAEPAKSLQGTSVPAARKSSLHKLAKQGFYAIRDNFSSIEQVQDALRREGLEASQLIIGIDYTKSNTWTGKRSFERKCLHDLTTRNPYQRVISIVARTLEAFDEDRMIPTYGFGDSCTTDKACFPFFPDERPCRGVREVLSRYNQITPGVVLSGPTNFAPLIHKAIGIVQKEQAYHILLIIADGHVTNKRETIAAIVEASKYALSIIMIGVGDGPWGLMHRFDDELPDRAFDNFQFVPFNDRMNNVPAEADPDATFALHALMECPEQYKLIQRMGYL